MIIHLLFRDHIFKLAVLAGILIAYGNGLRAQTVNHFSGWAAAFGSVSLNKKFGLHLETQFRSSNELKAIQNMLFRVGLNYRIKSNQILTAGYAYISSHRYINDSDGWLGEHRIWEQYINNQNFRAGSHLLSIQNRFRLEQRLIGKPKEAGGQLEANGYGFSQRFRYFFRFIIPFSKTTGKAFTSGTYFSLQNEIFLNLGDASTVNNKFFDQNRAYISFGYRFSPKNDTEIGYMYQYVSGSQTMRANNNIIQIATYIRL
jgi:hypothetical protein